MTKAGDSTPEQRAAVAVDDALTAYRTNVRRRLTDPERDTVLPFVEDLVRASEPKNGVLARDRMGHGVGLALYAVRKRRMPLKYEYVFKQSTVDAYLDAEVSDASRPTVASMLKQLVETALRVTDPAAAAALPTRSEVFRAAGYAAQQARLDRLAAQAEEHLADPAHQLVGALELPEMPLVPVEGRDTRAPYTVAQVIAYLRAAQGLRSFKARRFARAAVLVPLATGALGGPTSRVRGNDFVRRDNGLWVTLPGYSCPVPALAPYEDEVEKLALAAGTHYMLGGNLARHNRYSEIARLLAARGPHLPPLEAGRLRTTWVVTQLMLGTPLKVLLRAMNVTTPGELDDLLEYVPDPTDADLATLRGRAVVGELVAEQGTVGTAGDMPDCGVPDVDGTDDEAVGA